MSEAFLEINLENLKSNIKNLKLLLGPETKFMAVVKSNAYGHGIVECSKAAIEAEADWLGVVRIEEALELRKNNINIPILILGPVEKDSLNNLANNNISVSMFSLDFAKILGEMKFEKTLKVHLKIETGLNRLGLSPIVGGKLNISEIENAVIALKSNPQIEIEGIYSHTAAVEEDPWHTYGQPELLIDTIKELENRGFQFNLKHIAASAGAILLPQARLDMVRCGIAIYGLWPSKEDKKVYERINNSNKNLLMPVLTYKTKIMQIKEIEKGSSIGYGRTYYARHPMTIGILPIGYFEGIDRGLSNPGGRGEVLVNGQRCPIVGRIAMNMSTIDLSKVESHKLKVGAEVTIIGKQGDEEIAVDEIAAKLGTINYEIVSRIPAHIPRIYK